MRCARTLRPAQRYLFKFACGIAAIFFLGSASCAQLGTAGQQGQLPWAKELDKYPGLLPELAQLFGKLQSDVRFPSPRTQSRLLPLLPEATVYYAAFPNYGDVAHQALLIFRQELQSSAVLRDWWTQGERAADGPQIEDALDKFSQLLQFVGDEIVVSGAPSATEGKDPNFLVITEVRKPGLKQFLEEVLKQRPSKTPPGVRVLDLRELATAQAKPSANEFLVLVRSDFVVGASDLATLRNFSARLNQHAQGFAFAPFGRRIIKDYQGGATILAAADVHKLLNQAPSGDKQNRINFERSGFADMKYLVWKRSEVAGQSVSQAELSFTGPRHGAASWLAKPERLGSLDFVSPNAILAGTISLTSLPKIFDDIQELSGPQSANTFAGLAAGEKALNLSLKDDLLSQIAGEITVELDSFIPPQPAWKAILKVNDAQRLQQTLSKLLALAQFQIQHIEEAGLSYYTVRIPAQMAPVEIGYTFMDGYLILASSPETLAQAVRQHGSGESLAKSQKFLASLPLGRSPEASALLYQNPVGMTALMMRQASPELADSLMQFSKEMPPSVVCLYGDESAIREASGNGAFDAATTLVVAAIAIPNLLRSRIAANEATAVGSVRSVNTAQVTYAVRYPQRSYASNLATLGPDPRGSKFQSPDHASFLDESLANETCAGEAWCTKSGYHFRVTASCKLRVCREYVVVATPVDTNTGSRSFCSTSDGVIHFKPGPPLTSPLSASECRVWTRLQ